MSSNRQETKNNGAGGKSGGDIRQQLSPEDQARVDRYLDSSLHRVERKPFRPWFMMLVLLGVVTALSLLSLLISSWVL